jgi:hypothetical protein
MRSLPFVASLVALVVAGCHYTPVQVASSLTPVNSIRKYEILPRVSGEACTFKLFYLIPFGQDDRLTEALHDAVPLGLDYDDLIGVTVEEKTTIYVIGHEHCVLVSGYPIRYADSGGKGSIFSHEKNPRVAAAQPVPAPAPAFVAPAPVVAAPVYEPEPSSAPAPTPAPKPVVAAPRTTARPSTTPPAPAPVPAPTPVVVPTPAPAPAAPTVSSPMVAAGESPFKTGPDGQQTLDCGVMCKNYTAPLRNQSSVVQGIIFQKCVDKCNGGNMAFIECALDARSTTDVTRCNAL